MTDGIINFPTIKHALLMDIDHYESDERRIGLTGYSWFYIPL